MDTKELQDGTLIFKKLEFEEDNYRRNVQR